MEKGNRFSNPSSFQSFLSNWEKINVWEEESWSNLHFTQLDSGKDFACIEGDEITFPGG